MALVVGVHGIAQEQLGRRQLLGVWEPALADGLEAALGRVGQPLSFDLAYYGRLFLDTVRADEPVAKSFTNADEAVERWGEERGWEELQSAAEEAAGEEALQRAAVMEDKGFSRLPPGAAVIMRALDWRYGPGAALLLVGTLRQVRRYLRDPVLKAEIDAVVDAAVGRECRVLVGHSLGSVVAFEYVRRYPERELDLLLTLGSPLGARFVRALMPQATFGVGGLPKVGSWVNVRDPRDPVAFAGALSGWGWVVHDELVDNGRDAHASSRYLGKRATGQALLAAVPGLSG